MGLFCVCERSHMRAGYPFANLDATIVSVLAGDGGVEPPHTHGREFTLIFGRFESGFPASPFKWGFDTGVRLLLIRRRVAPVPGGLRATYCRCVTHE